MRQRTRSAAAICAVAGGTLWALTPLRQPLFHAGRSPAEGEAVFRFYNALIVVVAVLLTVALVRLLHEEYRPTGRAFLVGWWMMLVGQAMIFGGSLMGVMLGGWMTGFVMAAQDAGFVGALVAALGAVPLGIVGLRHAGLPTPASAMFVAALPIGLLATPLLTGLGVPEDFLGLPLTVLYGGAWVVMGGYWTLAPRRTEPVPPMAEGRSAPRAD